MGRLAIWLLACCPLSQAAETVELDFYLAQIPGVYEQQGEHFRGIYVEMLDRVARHAGVRFHYQLAPRERAVIELLHHRGCTSFSLPEPVVAPPGTRLLQEVGRTRVAAYVMPSSPLRMSEVPRLPADEVLAFGDDIAAILRKQGIAGVVIRGSLQKAVHMLQAGRGRVLFTTQSSLSGMPDNQLKELAVIGNMASWFACSRLLSGALQQRLQHAWRQLPPGK